MQDEATVEKEKADTAALFSAIGGFIFEFSQLEFIIRHALGDALDLRGSRRGSAIRYRYISL